MMRTTVSIGLAGCMMSGCVGFNGTSELKSSDPATYAGYVATSPMAFIGPLPHLGAVGFNYDVRQCFDQTLGTLKGSPMLVIGVDPLDRVCEQYDGIDLRDYPPDTLQCFVGGEKPEDRGYPLGEFRHPWLDPNPSPECAKLIADIQAARKVH